MIQVTTKCDIFSKRVKLTHNGNVLHVSVRQYIYLAWEKWTIFDCILYNRVWNLCNNLISTRIYSEPCIIRILYETQIIIILFKNGITRKKWIIIWNIDLIRACILFKNILYLTNYKNTFLAVAQNIFKTLILFFKIPIFKKSTLDLFFIGMCFTH